MPEISIAENAEVTRVPTETKIEREGETVRIYKPEGLYTVMYGNHKTPRSPLFLPGNLTALVVEGSTGLEKWAWHLKNTPLEKYRGKLPEIDTNSVNLGLKETEEIIKRYKQHIEYSNLFRKIEPEKIPLILADPEFKDEMQDLLPFLQDIDIAVNEFNLKLQDKLLEMGDPIRNVTITIGEASSIVSDAVHNLATANHNAMTYPIIVSLAEATVGSALFSRVVSQYRKQRRYKRRDFLKMGAKIAAGLWLSMPLVEGILFAKTGSQGEAIPPEWRKLIEATHPETWFLILTVRNTILAHKEEWFMRRLGKRPHLVTTIGSAHAGIEDQIMRTPAERLNFLRAAMPIIKKVFEPESIYSIAKFEYKWAEEFAGPEKWVKQPDGSFGPPIGGILVGPRWLPTNLYEVPDLKDLIAGDQAS